MQKMLAGLGAVLCLLPGMAGDPNRPEPIVGGPCEGCEAVFQGLPADPETFTRIAPVGEPGEKLVLEGVVRDAGGQPAPGIIVYAYHTDATGLYPRDERFRDQAAFRHGRLRAWARTDGAGRYRFETIRPGSYPGTNEPAHVHLHVIEPGRCTYYIDDVLFDDDPLLTKQRRDRLEGRGGGGLTAPRKGGDGTWRVGRDIVLGKKIPGYPAKGK